MDIDDPFLTDMVTAKRVVLAEKYDSDGLDYTLTEAVRDKLITNTRQDASHAVLSARRAAMTAIGERWNTRIVMVVCTAVIVLANHFWRLP